MRPRRSSGTFTSSIASLTLVGDNQTSAALVAWENQLKRAFVKLYPSYAIDIVECQNNEWGCSFILGKHNPLPPYEDMMVKIPEELGGRWYVSMDEVQVPGTKYASRTRYETTVIVTVGAAKPTDPVKKKVTKFVGAFLWSLACIYAFFISW
jgi:hypothetical protein